MRIDMRIGDWGGPRPVDRGADSAAEREVEPWWSVRTLDSAEGEVDPAGA